MNKPPLCARSNYVRVKDRALFQAWAGALSGVTVAEREGTFALLMNRGDDEEPIDIAREVVRHLAKGEVFIYCECGTDRRRQVSGRAVAVRDTGETLRISTEDIYLLVQRFWECSPTRAMF